MLDAKESLNASYAWKGIVRIRDIIWRAGMWRVGDEKTINIWGDNWLPCDERRKVLLDCRDLPCSSKVANLIDESQHTWRNDVIDHIFLPHEARMIKCIPLSSTNVPETLAWMGSKDGKLSVKSAYHMLMQDFNNDFPYCSDDSSNKVLWMKVWSLPEPNKIQNFIWQASYSQ